MTQPTKPAFSAADLGLPTKLPEITAYLMNSYKGVGKKTADSLLDRFGVGVFEALHERPDEVKAAIDERRANALIAQWNEDFARRSPKSGPPAPAPEAAGVAANAGERAGTPASSAAEQGPDSRAGGRGRGRGRKAPASVS